MELLLSEEEKKLLGTEAAPLIEQISELPDSISEKEIAEDAE